MDNKLIRKIFQKIYQLSFEKNAFLFIYILWLYVINTCVIFEYFSSLTTELQQELFI